MNSILIPTFCEQKNSFFEPLLQSLKKLQNIEILFIDGGSTDSTCDLIQKYGFKFVVHNSTNRAQRLNIGLKQIVGNMVLLHHPRTVLSEGAMSFFASLCEAKFWGGFKHRFDDPHWLLKFTSWYSNSIRSRRGILYLDHCIFAPRSWLDQIGGVPEVDIFEDTLLSKKLLKFSKPIVIQQNATTSAVRFQKSGYYKQALMNQYSKLQFYRGHSLEALNKLYEGRLQLNKKTKSKGDSL